MSQKRKILKKRASVTIPSDDFMVEGEDGEQFAPRAGEWVRFVKRVPMKLLRIAGRLERIGDDEESTVADVEALFEELIQLLGPLVLDWNWTDQREGIEPAEDGSLPRLPTPREDPAILWELDEVELMYLLSKQQQRTAAPDPT